MSRIKPYPETQQKGYVNIDSVPSLFTKKPTKCDFGVQIADDGRIWICIDGVSFLRFRPLLGEEEEQS